MTEISLIVTLNKQFNSTQLEEFPEKQRRVELKSVGNFVAKTVLVESANQFSLEELCKDTVQLELFFSKPYRPSDLWQNLKYMQYAYVP